jgi:hypothetical protein
VTCEGARVGRGDGEEDCVTGRMTAGLARPGGGTGVGTSAGHGMRARRREEQEHVAAGAGCRCSSERCRDTMVLRRNESTRGRSC